LTRIKGQAENAPVWKRISGAIVAMVTLAGCVAVDETRVGLGSYQLVTPANGQLNSVERARVILGVRSQELCPNGYERTVSRVVTDSVGRETLIWRIACRNPSSI
jgi:hypothetical protein